MGNEPVWLDADQIAHFNQLVVADTDEPFHLRDYGLLESALARPINHWYYGEQDAVALAQCADNVRYRLVIARPANAVHGDAKLVEP